MNIRTKLAALEIVLFLAFLTPASTLSQMPARPGKLHITSNPPRAKIIINDTPRSELTDVTLVVSPGAYKVKVGDCPAQDVAVSSGETKEVHCP